MKTQILLLAAAALLAAGCVSAPRYDDPDTQAASALAHRLLGKTADKIEFRLSEADVDVFRLSSRGSRIVIEGNNANSMAVGLNHYLKYYCLVNVGWFSWDRIDVPKKLPKVAEPVEVKARVEDRFFLNYCTYGYTMPWWQWSEWEHFIDWMALQGINLPLAITGQEAIWYKIWTELGLTDEEVRTYFTGPAHLPWHRMLNIDHWGSPLPMSWLDGQAELQKKIVARERELNMRPVLPAFAGHVPPELNRIYPEAQIERMSDWAGFDLEDYPYFLDPMDPLFPVIQKKFVEKETEIYGTDHIYGIDLFNEMIPKSWEPDYLSRVSRQCYESLAAADPDAVWLQMTWLFWNERKYWTQDRIEPYITSYPAEKSLLLDYYCERQEVWRQTKSYYGVPFIWCYLGNFGGNTNVQGRVKEAGKRIEQALAECGDNLVGIGSTLEGLDVQQFPYEYILEKAWDFGKTDEQVINELADRHAGHESEPARQAWKLLYDSVLDITPGNFAAPLPCSYPAMGKDSRTIKYNTDDLLAVWDYLLSQDEVTTDAMAIDLIWVGRQLLGDLFLVEKQAMDKAYKERDREAFFAHSDVLYEILSDMDNLNSHHPHATLAHWLKQARALGSTPKVKDYYEMNARRLITTWGGSLNDYACRNWSGLLWDYYGKRWENYIREVTVAVLSGREFDEASYRAATDKFQEKWVTSTEEVVQGTADEDLLTHCRHLREKYSFRF